MAKILLDTHVWLWLNTNRPRLGPTVLAQLENDEIDLYLSLASVWEIVLKHQKKKLPLPESPDAYVTSRLEKNGVATLPIEAQHIFRTASLPSIHSDPFDRLIVAQAQAYDLLLMTADQTICQYDCKTQLV